ncbi:MAG TPA: DUF4962 domain-containing protein [Planctomycetaceae bacterium]|nr:DUF4962 domain-containing protein [Planctomycetaceae bacterium]
MSCAASGCRMQMQGTVGGELTRPFSSRGRVRAGSGRAALVPTLAAMVLVGSATGARPVVDDRGAKPGEWGFRPAQGVVSAVTPPAFVWRPQKGAKSYALQCSRSPSFQTIDYEVKHLEWNVHCPPTVLAPGRWWWRFRFTDAEGRVSAWSRVRSFRIAEQAEPFPLPDREELLSRIPRKHPRLFVRPEQLDELRRRARSDLRPLYQDLVAQCEKILKHPPPTDEPPKYPPGMKWGSDE